MAHFFGGPHSMRRGRPRASYAEMGEFDLSLIREFKSRPELYDRNSPLFKDKMLSAQRWQEISNKLGFDVALLKDRMLQLRNRYNIEKRRLEQIRDENNADELEPSPWPVFEHLQFLSDHIRPRRSYKRLAANNPNYYEEDPRTVGYESRKHSYSSTELAAPYFANVEVKEEKDSDRSDEERESTENGGPAHNQTNSMLPPQNQYSIGRNHAAALAANPSITIRRLDTLRENNSQRVTNPYAKNSQPTYAIVQKPNQYVQQQQRQIQNIRQYRQRRASPLQISQPIKRFRSSIYNNSNNSVALANNHHQNSYNMISMKPTERLKVDTRTHKYTAFGYFLSSLLEELPRDRALDLVQRFTSELVSSARTDQAKKQILANGSASPTEKEEEHRAEDTTNASSENGVEGGGSLGTGIDSANEEDLASCSALLGM